MERVWITMSCAAQFALFQQYGHCHGFIIKQRPADNLAPPLPIGYFSTMVSAMTFTNNLFKPADKG